MTFAIKKSKYKLRVGKQDYYFQTKKDLSEWLESEPVLYKGKMGDYEK